MTNDYSLTDIATATGGGRNNDGIFGGNGAWFLIILFLFAFMGWGGGWGGRGAIGGTDGVMNNYVLTSDFSQLSRQLSDAHNATERKLDSINNGLCSGFYQESQLINGVNMQAANNTAALTQAVNTGFANNAQNMTVQGYETRNAIAGIGTQLAQCCCDNKAAIADLKYTVAMGDNQTSQSIAMAARDIIDNQNAAYRSLHDEITANRIEDKNAQIQAQQQQIFALQLAASQSQQNQYLVNQLKPCPIPAYPVPNPNCCYQNVAYANNNGCGCA